MEFNRVTSSTTLFAPNLLNGFSKNSTMHALNARAADGPSPKPINYELTLWGRRVRSFLQADEIDAEGVKLV